MRTSNRTETDSAKKLHEILNELRSKGDPRTLKGMSRFGIQTTLAYGVSMPELRRLAREIGTSHELALKLWRTKIHEARLLAGMIDNPALVTRQQMNDWASEFDSWDVVDGTCGNLFDKTPFAVAKAHEWSGRQEEYVKRAGFALMAELAVHDTKMADKTFLEFLPQIIRGSSDDRNFVKKAVNWALRQIGKRNPALNTAATSTCKSIGELGSRSAKWIAADALRELTSASVQKRLRTTSTHHSSEA